MFTQQNRERIEWTNCWWSEACKKKERILLVGDSVTRNMRGRLEKLLYSTCAVDLFATSFSIHDSLFWKHLKLYLETSEYMHSCIIVQYGVQHGKNLRCSENEKNKQEFREQYVRLLEVLHEHCEKIVLLTSNSNMLKPDFIKINEAAEREIVCRNRIIEDIGKQLGYRVFDFYSLIREREYKFIDHVHIEGEGYDYAARVLLRFLLDQEVLCLDGVKERVVKVVQGEAEKGNVIIYGAGENAKKIYSILAVLSVKIDDLKFVQTDLNVNYEFCGRQVICIDDIPIENRKRDTLIISSPANYDAMKQKADSLGFKNIIRYEDIMKAIELE